MARLFHGIAKGFKSKRGFTAPTIPESRNTEFIRPKFSGSVQQFIRKTVATYWTPWPFGAEGGASIVNASIVETITAIDAPSAIFTGLAAIIEPGNAVDTPSSVGILLSSITESATASETSNRTILTSVAITEGLTVSDTESVIATLVGAIIESALAEEMHDFGGGITYPVDITEVGVAEETETSAIITQSDILEEAIAEEISDRTILTPASMVEGLTAEDICNATYIILKLFNGLRLVHNITPTDNDLRIKVEESILGIPVIAVTDDPEGAVRIKVNGVVKALRQAI